MSVPHNQGIKIMTQHEITVLAERALTYKHLGTSEAIERVAGKFSTATKDLHSAIYDAMENILFPHGTGEDATYCEY